MNNGLLENNVLILDQATPGTGPLGPVIDHRLDPRSETYLSIDHNIRSKVDNNFTPVINAQDVSSQQYVNDKYVNFTGREQIMPTVIEQANLKGDDQYHNLSINDARTTTKQTTLFSYAGDAQNEKEGTNWWRYEDAPKTTTNQTTLFSYAGDAQNEKEGTNWWRYEDAPKTTTNQTTLYSYAGNSDGYQHKKNHVDRTQFTGETENVIAYLDDGTLKQDIITYKSGNAGVTNWNQRGSTNVENYFPGPNGNQNIQLDPDENIGFTELRTDCDSMHTNGAGSYMQALPNGENFQQVFPEMIGEVMPNSMKNFGVDNLQTANYLITNLQNNPFSIYQRPEQRDQPNNLNFFVSANPSNFSAVTQSNMSFEPLQKVKKQHGEVNVFGDNNEYIYNPNAVITNNTLGQSNNTIENPLLFQRNTPHKTATFLGKGYPGNAISANNSKDLPILLDTNMPISSSYLNTVC